MVKGTTRRLRYGASVAAMAAALALSAPALAQTTGTIRGEGAQPGGTVTVTDVNTGQTATATVDAEGTFVIVGLRPSTYRVSGVGGAQEVVLPVGQTVTIAPADAAAAEADAVNTTDDRAGEEVVVTGRRNRTEVRTATVGTSVSQTQIENLPQNDRNFLNFANLAPGVTVNSDPRNKTVQAGGVSADNVNVFVDGTSFKNRVGFNGIAGQNFSQGNPFPQSAVQEFRVETQNFKAEYEQAGSAIITAVTRTGGRQFSFTPFAEYQPQSFLSRPFFDRPGEANNRGFPCPDDATRTCYNPRPDYERRQYGGGAGGPIIPGTLHFFAAYEATRQRNPSITVNVPASLPQFTEASFANPFNQDLYFGKLTLFASAGDTINATYFRREETDIRDYGDRRLRENGRNIGTTTTNYQLEWDRRGTTWLNELRIGRFDSDTGTPTLTTGPEIRITSGIDGGELLFAGANSFQQANRQKDLNFKNNFTFTGFDGHVIKVGALIARNELIRIEDAFANGQYNFDATGFTDFATSTPYRAIISILPPTPLRAKNTYIGLFAQDDWTINENFTLNYGLRWDYETNNFNQSFVTPERVATALRNYQPWVAAGIDAEDYISTGNNRKPFTGAFAPRLGLSYDVFGDRDLIFFAGAGRYYDRNNFYNASLERLFLTVRSDVNVRFCGAPGIPTCSRPGGNIQAGEIQFQPAYRDPQALRTALGAEGLNGDIWVLNNDTPVPYTDQFNLGVRKRFGDWQTSVTFAHNRGHDAFIFVRGNRQPDGQYTPAGPGFIRDNFPAEGRPAGYTGRLNIGSSNGESRYTAMYFQIEKPFLEDSDYGLTAQLTLSDAKSNQARSFGDAQAFNLGEQDAYGYQPVFGLERWRFVGSGILRLPLDFRLSSTVTLASGPRFGFVTFARSEQPCDGCIPFNEAGVFGPEEDIAFEQVDVRLSKRFRTPLGEIEGSFQVYNLFDSVNRTYSTWGAGNAGDGLEPPLTENSTTGVPRSFQAGLRYRF